MPRATWGEVKSFCRKQGYRETEDGDHWRAIKRLSDGSSSGTMVSHSFRDADTVAKSLWTLVWRHQLRLRAENDFWSGLSGGPVNYDIPKAPTPREPLPQYLVQFLIDVRHYSPEQIAATTRDEAQSLWNAYHSRELLED